MCFRYDFADLLDIVVHVVLHVSDLNVNRIAVAEIQSQLSHRLWPRCREHKGLSVRSNLPNDFSNGWLETHVEHSISFIKNQVGYSSQVDHIAFQEINESARCCNHDVTTSSQLAFLDVFWSTSIDTDTADFTATSKLKTLLLNLIC